MVFISRIGNYTSSFIFVKEFQVEASRRSSNKTLPIHSSHFLKQLFGCPAFLSVGTEKRFGDSHGASMYRDEEWLAQLMRQKASDPRYTAKASGSAATFGD